MEYVTDAQGQVLVMDDKGNRKYFHKNLINDAQLMRRLNFKPVPKPLVEEPKEGKKQIVAEAAGAKTPGNIKN